MTELKMTIGAISFLCKEWVHWQSIPSRRLWQSTETGCRWGRCSIYRHPVTAVIPQITTPIFQLECGKMQTSSVENASNDARIRFW